MPTIGERPGIPLQVPFRLGLHGTHDHVLHEPVPKELLIAAGTGAAKWDALSHEWGARGGEHAGDAAASGTEQPE